MLKYYIMLNLKQMKLKKIITIFSITLALNIYSQTTPQFFTPKASELGKYGQVPVSYFNGLANISIPLTTFIAKGYNLPIYMTYYAAGNHPDDHPDWVGLGWSLHAGGIINRKINGLKDEISKEEKEYVTPKGGLDNFECNYITTSDKVQKEVNWNDEKNYWDIYQNEWRYFNTDTEPDEFQINIDDISASFYIVGDGEVKIKSKSNIDFKVEIKLDSNKYEYIIFKNLYNKSKGLKGMIFTYIKEIVITKNNGTKYIFGGDMNAIEFSFNPMPVYEVSNQTRFNKNEFKALGTANSWHLKEIKLTNGEIISFKYEKDGTPIVVNDKHSLCAKGICDGSNCYDYYHYDSKQFSHEYANLSYTYLQPSYLESIKSEITKNEFYFKRSRTCELNYNITKDAFESIIGNFFYIDTSTDAYTFKRLMEQDYYMRLDEIIFRENIINFKYIDTPEERLKLLSVHFQNKNGDMLKSYKMEYNNTKLPPYNAKKNDNWGYYNNKYYNDINYSDLAKFRTADDFYMKAEILEKITYPTGGYSIFNYEPHSYSTKAQQFPFVLIKEKGISGGLRIKKISTFNNSKCISREFEYVNKDGTSSGILSGNTNYYTTGNQLIDGEYIKWFGLVTKKTKLDGSYIFGSQNMINQLSQTNGNHVTYSRVIEKTTDSTSIVYEYSNHNNFMDEYPMEGLTNFNNINLENKFTSKELERGLLLKKEYYNSKGKIIRKEDYKYNSNPKRYDDYVKSINQYFNNNINFYRYAYVKHYTFCPYLIAKQTTDYLSKNLNGITTDTLYKYNNNKLLIEKSIVNSAGINYKYCTKYICDYDLSDESLISHPIKDMQRLNFLNYPVEEKIIANEKLINANLITYMPFKFGNNTTKYMPNAYYKLNSKNGTDKTILLSLQNKQNFYSISNLLNKTNEYSYYEDGNLKELIDYKSNITTTYLWGFHGLYPVAEIKNAKFQNVLNALGEYYIYSALVDNSTSTEQIEELYHKIPNALITIYSYEPFIGMTSKTDNRGYKLYYEYDIFERLKSIVDKNKIIIKEFEYNYKK